MEEKKQTGIRKTMEYNFCSMVNYPNIQVPSEGTWSWGEATSSNVALLGKESWENWDGWF